MVAREIGTNIHRSKLIKAVASASKSASRKPLRSDKIGPNERNGVIHDGMYWMAEAEQEAKSFCVEVDTTTESIGSPDLSSPTPLANDVSILEEAFEPNASMGILDKETDVSSMTESTPLYSSETELIVGKLHQSCISDVDDSAVHHTIRCPGKHESTGS